MKLTLYLTDVQTGKKDSVTLQGNTFTIGRSVESDIVIDNSNISRKHAILQFKKNSWFIEDCGSSNGTYIKVDGKFEKISGKQKLTESTTIRLSNCKILSIAIDATVDTNNDQLISKQLKNDDPQPPWKKILLGLKGSLSKEPDNKPSFYDKMGDDSSQDLSMMIPIDSLKKMVAIIVLDQCDSSGLANSNEQVAYHLKKRMKELTNKVLDKHKCQYYEGTGDGFLGVYDDPTEALQVAKKITKLINKRNDSSKNPDIHFRLALHYGEVYSLGTGLHGNDLNITFRIEGATSDMFPVQKHNFPKKDRTLCSENFLNYFKHQEQMPSKINFKYCGSANLKGISNPMNIYQVIYQD
ncbi:MAG: adenylate/guanylate cyclase domain-containing protein [Magnetococcales bacterium]|nr:adenylate/guanylate cyclase domain-containing protein [Magnetococcales bacterium]